MVSEKKNKLLVWLSLIVMVGAFCLQFYQDFQNLLIRWDSDDFSYCYLVPFLFGYLVYTNRKSLEADRVKSSGWGFIVLAISAIVYLGGKFGSVETLTYGAIWLAVVGMVLLVMGGGVIKTFAFPFLILAFIVPLPPFLNRMFTFKLKLISSDLSVRMMRALGLSVFGEGNIIDLGVTQLQVVDACSGLRYVYPLVLMGLVFAYLFHKKWWDRVIIIAATIPISVLSNALRIAITGYLTLKVSPEAAEGFFHGFSGWLIFMVSFVFLAVLSWALKMVGKKKKKRRADEAGKAEQKESGALLSLARVQPSYPWIAAAFFVGVWWFQGVYASATVIPQRMAFDGFPLQIGDWQGERFAVDEQLLEEELWADDYVQVYYKNAKTGDALLLFVPYYEYQGTRHTVHSPVACIVGGGGYAPRSRTVLEREFPAPFGNVGIRQMVFEKGNHFLLSNYWFQQRGRIIVSEYWNKWFMFRDSVAKRRTDGALIRIEMALGPGQTVDEGQKVIDAFTVELMKILPEYVPN